MQPHHHHNALGSAELATTHMANDDLRKKLATMDLHKTKDKKISKAKAPIRKNGPKNAWTFFRFSSFFGMKPKEQQEDSDDSGGHEVDHDSVMVEQDQEHEESEESKDDLDGDTLLQNEENEENLEKSESENDYEGDTLQQYEENDESDKEWESEYKLDSDSSQGDDKSENSTDDEESEDDLDAETMVEHSSSKPGTENEDESSMVEENEKTIKPRRRRIQPMQSVYNDRYLSLNDPRVIGWTKDEIWLFNKLARRGTEPLLYYQMTSYFQAFPNILFTHKPNEVYLNNHHTSQTHLAHALTNLINAGSWVNDCIDGLGTGPVERPLYLQIRFMHKWSLMDGQFQWKAHIPVVAIAVATTKEESIRSVVDRVTRRLHKLGRRYRDKWRHPDCSEGDVDERFVHKLPTLYGIVIKHSVTAIVTCDSSVPDKPIRTILTCNWATQGQEVWYTLAVAITLARARNYLMQLDKEGELGPLIIDHGPDPDA
ncbi:hypothetical protein P7C71_g3729, partial [Lecanoromycetidae sp. Uapishka_2]